MSKNIWNFIGAVLIAIVSLGASQTAAMAQQKNLDFSGKGKNIAFSVIGVEPNFFGGRYADLKSKFPELYLQRVATANGDDFLALAVLSDADPAESLGGILSEIDQLDGVKSSRSWLGSVKHFATPLTNQLQPKFGYVVAKLPVSGPARANAIDRISTQLGKNENVVLVAETSRGADLLVLYRLDAGDISGHNAFMSSLDDIFGAETMRVSEGYCLPVGWPE